MNAPYAVVLTSDFFKKIFAREVAIYHFVVYSTMTHLRLIFGFPENLLIGGYQKYGIWPACRDAVLLKVFGGGRHREEVESWAGGRQGEGGRDEREMRQKSYNLSEWVGNNRSTLFLEKQKV